MDPLVVYAAVVATAGIVWQFFTWLHRRRRRVTVEVRHEVGPALPDVRRYLDIAPPPEGYKAGDENRAIDPDPVGRLGYCLQVVVTNRGETSQFVEQIGLRRVSEEVPFVFDAPDDKALRPSDSIDKEFWLHELPRGGHRGLSGDFVGVALIGPDVIESRPQRLHKHLLHAVERITLRHDT